jgi:hypothetical protein
MLAIRPAADLPDRRMSFEKLSKPFDRLGFRNRLALDIGDGLWPPGNTPPGLCVAILP